MPTMKSQSLLYSLKKKIFTLIGDIELHPYPAFFLYHPKGYLIKGSHFADFVDSIQKHDVVLRRYDAYVDNRFIPGFWNHAGICTGIDEITHAISDGVVKESFFDFCKCDYICVLRPKFTFSQDILEERLKKAIDKEYDFSFDFRDNDKFSCTELIHYAFQGFESGIPLSKMDYFFFQQELVVPDEVYKSNFKVIYDSRFGKFK